jgi:O-antigen/teichoic acid export membrane protein
VTANRDEPSLVARVLRNSAALAMSRVLERGTGFVMAILVAAQLGVEGLGVYAAAWALYGMISLAGDAGATNYLIREISRDSSLTASYTVHLTVVAGGAAAILMLAAELVVPHVGYTAEMRTGISVMLLAIVPKVLNVIQEGVFVAHGRVALETVTRFVAGTTYVGLSAWMLAGGHGVVDVLRTFVAIEAVVCVTYFVLINRCITRLRPRFRPRLAWRLIKEIRYFAASSAIAAVFARPEVVILSLLATPRQVGFYSAGMRVAELGLVVPEVFMANVFPVLSSAYRTAEAQFARWQAVSVRAMLAYSLPLAGFLLVAANDIVRLLFGDGFETAATVLRLMSGNIVAFSLVAVFWRSLVARGGQRTNVVIQLAMAAVRLAVGVVLIGAFTAVGAAIAAAATAGLTVWLLARATARRGAPQKVLGLAWRILPAAGASALLVRTLLDHAPLPLALAAGAAVYLPAAVACGAITAEDRRIVSAARTRRPMAAGLTDQSKA